MRLSTTTLSLFLSTFLLFNSAKAQDTLKSFLFANSLVNHELQVIPTPSQETSVPHWMHFLAEEAGRVYAASGQYGFLQQHATNLPPISQWGFDYVTPAWDSDTEPFSAPNFDNVFITPANFTQWQPPHVNYFQDTLSPLSASRLMIDWVNQNEDSLIIYIYEGWPDMAPYLANGFPPTSTEWANYDSVVTRDYHDWFLEYQDSLIADYPNQCVRMIPTGPVISSLLNTSPFDQIPVDTLYEDDAPHGRPTIYFLAALVTYMSLYEEPAPLTYQVPSIIDATIANNYATVVNHIWNELLNFNNQQGDSRVFCPNSTVGIDESISEDQIEIYPNPTPGPLTIQFPSKNYRIEIADLTGKIQRTYSTGTMQLDISDLPNGLYILRIINSLDHSTVIRKVLKQD